MTQSLDHTQEVVRIARGLGRAQRRVILSLTEDWGKAACHTTAKRIWYGIRGWHYLIDHKHCTDNCWRLRPIGLAVRAYLQEPRT